MNSPEQIWTDADIISALHQTNEFQVNEACKILYDRYSQQLCAYVVRQWPALNQDGAKDVLQETIVEFINTVRKPEYKGKDHVDCQRLFFGIAFNRTMDAGRKMLREYTKIDRFCSEVANRLAGTQTGTDWKGIANTGGADAIRNAFKNLYPDLPDLQRATAKLMLLQLVGKIPDELSNAELAIEVSKILEREVSEASYKTAKAIVRRKFRELLAAKKYEIT
jgi:hypothetical protein